MSDKSPLKTMNMKLLYKLLGFKELKILAIQEGMIIVEHQDNDDLEIPLGLLEILKDKKISDTIWIK